MMRLVRNIGAGALVMAFLVPLLGYGLSAYRGVTEAGTENRRLAPWPEWNGSARDYTAAIDAHLSDRFGGRMTLIRFARDVKDNLGEDPPQVVRGQAPWLFLGHTHYRDEFEGVGQWTDADVARWADTLLAVQAELARRGIPFAATIGPDKARIYPEHLPGDWSEGRRRFKAALASHPALQGPDSPLVDAEPGILARKASGERVYWTRDTHWTASGSYPAAMALMDRIDPDGHRPRYAPAPARPVTNTRVLDMELMSGQSETREPEGLMIDFPERGEVSITRPHRDDNGIPVRNEFATIIVEDARSDEADGTLVVVGDSFADTMMNHFLHSFDRVVRIHHLETMGDITLDEVLRYEPDAVVFMGVERSLARKRQPLSLDSLSDEDAARIFGSTAPPLR